MNKLVISILVLGVSATPVAIGASDKLESMSEKNARDALRDSVTQSRESMKTQSKQDNIDAMQLALNGCIPLVDVSTEELMLFIADGIPVRRVGSLTRVIQDGDVVCSAKGDVSQIQSGVTTNTKNVGFENLDAYENIYKRYLK